tara:strand:+ start:1111 stop:1734 length:624 start_codon:yes stop_codon:yes gene_type:complete
MVAGIIELTDGSTAKRTPVFKKQNHGEVARLALVRTEKRKILKENDAGELVPDLKENGAFKFEIVLHGVAMAGTTMSAGIGDEINVPSDGDEVRLICRAGAYKQWIDSTKTIKRPVRCGDVVQYTIDTAQAYVGKKKQGDPMLTAEAVAERRRKSPGMVIGFYGEMTLEPGSNPEIITRCCDLYQEHQAINLDNGPTVGGQDDMPDV